MQLPTARVFLATIAVLSMSAAVHAQFTMPFTPPFRDLPDTEFSGWDVFTNACCAPNLPDDPASTSDDATLTQTTPGAILAGSGNIYHPTAVTRYVIADSIPTPAQQVLLQIRTTGNLPDLNSPTLSYTDGGGQVQELPFSSTTTLLHIPPPVFDTIEVLFTWDLTSNPDAVLDYTLEFAASLGSMSLDAVLLDVDFRDANIGTSYCTSLSNSSGLPATISAVGSTTVSENFFTLRIADAPANVFGIYYFGPNQIATPFGDGFRCVGGTTVRIQPPETTNAAGANTLTLDLGAYATIAPGADLNFQFWFRDTLAQGTGFNLSDGVNVSFD